MKTHIFALLLTAICLSTTAMGNDIYEDARDPWTLMDQGLLNRQLHEQIRSPEQQFRLGKSLKSFAVAADGATGGQQSLPGTEYDQTRFHGYFILDTYSALRLFESMDINVNLNFINPSFCDGYHQSFQLLGGMSVHLHKTVRLFDKPLRLDALIMDLDLVTIGEGLLIEQIPLEGFSFSATWNHVSLSAHIAARVFWNYDDFLAIPLSFFDGRLTFLAAFWYFTEPAGDTESNAFDVFRASNKVQEHFPYIGISAHQNFGEHLHIAAEYLARIKDRQMSNGVLLRSDIKARIYSRVALHLGYQFRFYEQHFAPSHELSEVTTSPALPERENMYATNSFEYFAISPWFHQLSHTVMTEVHMDITRQFQLFYELEYWVRWVTNNSNNPRVLYVSGYQKAPGIWHDIFYHAGLRYRLFRNAPHRASIFISNKWIASDTESTTPMPIRYIRDPLFGFELEVFL
ncbi:MAG: hypothetical protein JXX29_15945 [Deltaproteobacteria bacterium]|nr:hypothetical protein [Deltaproteobacteria bacterium]MBN2673174.1 hypothetical protein [Deltaproteobacteria bacterium]